MLRTDGKTPAEEVVALIGDWRQIVADSQERAMLEFAEQIADDAASITPDDLARLRQAGFDDTQILEITLNTAYRCLITKVADALGVELDEHYRQDQRIVEAVSFRDSPRTAVK